MEYKPLKENFTKKGFEYKLIKRVGDKAIFEQTKGKKIKLYEVIKIRRHDGYTIAGVTMEPAETYPSDSEWGTFGWTFTNLEKAQEKLESI